MSLIARLGTCGWSPNIKSPFSRLAIAADDQDAGLWTSPCAGRLGDVLLADALEQIIAAGAIRAIVVDAATAAGRALYARFGFVPAPGHADRMIVRAETIAQGLRGV